MSECDEMKHYFEAQDRSQVHLAVIADDVSVAEMHIDMALFSSDQAQFIEEICDEG